MKRFTPCTVTITNLETRLRVGIWDHEREFQPIRINLSLHAIDAARLSMEPHPLTPALSQRERVRNGHDEIETSSCRINKVMQSLLRRKQFLDWVVSFDEGRLDHDVAEVFLDVDVLLEHILDDALIMDHAARDELQQIVESAAHQVALDDFVDAADGGFKLCEVFATVVGQRHLSEHQLHGAQFFELQLGTVTDNKARLLKPLYPDQARARRQSNGIGQIHVRNPAVTLQMTEDTNVDPIQFERVMHHRYIPFSVNPPVPYIMVAGNSAVSQQFHAGGSQVDDSLA